jgi:hypothetical protein
MVERPLPAIVAAFGPTDRTLAGANAEVFLKSPFAGRNDWHLRSVPSAVNGVSRVVFRSTAAKEIAAVKRIAAQKRF